MVFVNYLLEQGEDIPSGTTLGNSYIVSNCIL